MEIIHETIDIFNNTFNITKTRSNIEGVWRILEIERANIWDECS